MIEIRQKLIICELCFEFEMVRCEGRGKQHRQAKICSGRGEARRGWIRTDAVDVAGRFPIHPRPTLLFGGARGNKFIIRTAAVDSSFPVRTNSESHVHVRSLCSGSFIVCVDRIAKGKILSIHVTFHLRLLYVPRIVFKCSIKHHKIKC